METDQIRSTLHAVAEEYPDGLKQHQHKDVDRIAFNIQLTLRTVGSSVGSTRVCDVGGGVGLFSLGCAALGFESVVLVDDFGDGVNQRYNRDILDIHRSYGVSVRKRDVLEEGAGKFKDDLDVVTSFDTMEHLHHSPKNLFRNLLQSLRPGGGFVLGVPNCINLRKRLTVPFGYGKWSSMEEWYEADTFRGHVREPDVQDLRYIADDLNLEDPRVYGRNWMGHRSSNRAVQIATQLVDWALRYRPSLCSNIYLSGRCPE